MALDEESLGTLDAPAASPVGIGAGPFPTGIAPLDRQHGQIHRALSNLCETLQVHPADFALTQRVQHLLGLAEEHFSSEEELMAGMDYPGFLLHRSKHRLMLVRARHRIQRSLEAGDPPPRELAQEILAAFSLHIQRVDMEFAAFLHGEAQKA